MLTRRELVIGTTAAVATTLAQNGQAVKKAPSLPQAASDFISKLDAGQKEQALLPFDSEERLNWHYVPRERKGLPFKSLSPEQHEAAHALLAVSLSKSGCHKAEAIRHLEPVLAAIEKGSGPVRDHTLYYFTFFGKPSSKGTWGWRYEGHHVSLHWTIVKGKIIASTPQFLGSNPAEVRSGPLTGTRILSSEEDLGRALVKSLTADQRIIGVFSDIAPPDIYSAAQRKAAILEDKGISYTQLNKTQQGLFLALLQEYANVQVQAISKYRLDAIRKAGLEAVKFAWMGGIEKGQPHYYRLQGSTFLVEYDNTQNDANHIHSVWRDFAGDFGEDLLALHYHTADQDHGHNQQGP